MNQPTPPNQGCQIATIKFQSSICLASKLPKDKAETFVRAHIEGLKSVGCDVRCLSGIPPHTDDRDGFIFHRQLPERLWRKLPFRGQETSEEEDRELLMARYFRRNGIDVVLAEYGPVSVAVMRACRRAGVPLVAHFHGSDAFQYDVLQENEHEYKELFQIAAAVIGVSRDMCEQLRQLGAPAENVHWIPCCVDPAVFCGANPAAAEPRFLTVGRFVEKKAPHLTLLAFAKVVEQRPDARLVMVGDGPLLGVCRQLAEYYGIGQSVEFTGAQDHQSVRDQMLRARAFVQHSIRASSGDAEGTPVSVTEAQACGLPVVATRHMGIKDVVVEGETGLLVDEFDVDAMSAALLQLADSPTEAARLGQAGRERIISEFSAERQINQLASLVKTVSENQVGSVH